MRCLHSKGLRPPLYSRTLQLSCGAPHLRGGVCVLQFRTPGDLLVQGTVSWCHSNTQPGKGAMGAFLIFWAQGTARGFHHSSQVRCPRGTSGTPRPPKGRGQGKAALDSPVPSILSPARPALNKWLGRWPAGPHSARWRCQHGRSTCPPPHPVGQCTSEPTSKRPSDPSFSNPAWPGGAGPSPG